MISFIVPAHNEQASLGRTLEAIHKAARAVGQPYEIILVDDASTDATPEIAAQNNARVVSVNHRQIAATRNSGAHAALGERLFFVDADTTINTQAVASALRCMDRNAVGGGAPAQFDGEAPLYARLLLWLINWLMRLAEISGGAFMFCTRDAFHAVGGFDERLYGAEDAAMSAALKRAGRFVVLSERVLTSGRRVRSMSGLQLLLTLIRVALSPSRILTQRAAVQKIWYDSNRENDGKMANSLLTRISNGAALLILSILVTIPIWILPWPQALLASPLGSLRFGARIIIAHVGLVLWPCSLFFLRSLIRQKRWLERVKLVLLIGFSLWFASQCTRGVFRAWEKLFHWLAG